MAGSIIPYPELATGKETRIYGLCDPQTGELRYVGKTTATLVTRLREHMKVKRRSHRTHWLKSISERGDKPDIFELELVPPYGDWVEAERHWIAIARFLGCRLVNATVGGEGSSGYRHTKETLEKMSFIQRITKRNPQSEETKGKRSEILRGRPAHNKGVSPSEETRQKIRLALVGKVTSEATKSKISHALKGHEVSDQTRKKMSAELKGKPNANKGMKMPEWSIRQKAVGHIHSKKMKEKWADPEFRRHVMESTAKAKALKSLTVAT